MSTPSIVAVDEVLPDWPGCTSSTCGRPASSPPGTCPARSTSLWPVSRAAWPDLQRASGSGSLLLVCASGPGQEGRLATLASHGVAAAGLAGGTQGWRAAGNPLEQPPGPVRAVYRRWSVRCGSPRGPWCWSAWCSACWCTRRSAAVGGDRRGLVFSRSPATCGMAVVLGLLPLQPARCGRAVAPSAGDLTSRLDPAEEGPSRLTCGRGRSAGDVRGSCVPLRYERSWKVAGVRDVAHHEGERAHGQALDDIRRRAFGRWPDMRYDSFRLDRLREMGDELLDHAAARAQSAPELDEDVPLALRTAAECTLGVISLGYYPNGDQEIRFPLVGEELTSESSPWPSGRGRRGAHGARLAGRLRDRPGQRTGVGVAARHRAAAARRLRTRRQDGVPYSALSSTSTPADLAAMDALCGYLAESRGISPRLADKSPAQARTRRSAPRRPCGWTPPAGLSPDQRLLRVLLDDDQAAFERALVTGSWPTGSPWTRTPPADAAHSETLALTALAVPGTAGSWTSAPATCPRRRGPTRRAPAGRGLRAEQARPLARPVGSGAFGAGAAVSATAGEGRRPA